MTAEQFLDWERQQDLKWEFDGFEPVAMTGGTDAHSAICGNILTALNNRLRGKPCRPRGPDFKVQTGTGYRYPDALVTCTPVPLDADIAAEPVVLFEVLSKSTARSDQTTKLLEYRAIPSVQHYVLLDQEQAIVTVYSRRGGEWIVTQLLNPDTLPLPEIGVEIPVSELYADVSFPESLKPA